MASKAVIGLTLIVIVLGLGAGYVMANSTPSASSPTVAQTAGDQSIHTATEIGSTDTKAFPDAATGTIEAGGLGAEGTHKLIREGGPDQTVYLLSSVVDLNEFVGKRVELWGQTLKAAKAAWLMDVGRVKLLD